MSTKELVQLLRKAKSPTIQSGDFYITFFHASIRADGNTISFVTDVCTLAIDVKNCVRVNGGGVLEVIRCHTDDDAEFNILI